MKFACPYCGVQMGDGAPMRVTPLRAALPSASVDDFRMIDVERVLSGLPRPTEVRVVQTCEADACVAKAKEVRPR